MDPILYAVECECGLIFSKAITFYVYG